MSLRGTRITAEQTRIYPVLALLPSREELISWCQCGFAGPKLRLIPVKIVIELERRKIGPAAVSVPSDHQINRAFGDHPEA